MENLIIKCHPYAGSFASGVAESIEEILRGKSETESVSVIDLVADGFDPVMRAEDLRLWSKGKSCDDLVKNYQNLIAAADRLIFPFPVWWGAAPAVLKGFCDKVLLPGFAYTYGEQGEMVGLLTGKKAVVITTMQTPVDIFHSFFGNPVEGAFIKDTLQACGIVLEKRFEIDQIVSLGRKHAEDSMRKIEDYFKVN